ncbi:MAG: hypothetical protein R2877_07370 [Bdellovibrionota bacterium]
MISRIAFWMLWLVWIGSSYAHPVAYAGSVMFESYNTPDMSENNVIYSPRPWLSVGVQNFHFDGALLDENALYPRVAFLKRWNRMDWQTNLYAWGGVGWARLGSNDDLSFLGGAQLDSESRRWYFATQLVTLQHQSLKDVWMSRSGVGVAPYLANSGELQGFLIVQAFYNSIDNEPWIIGPMIRMFYKSIFLEVGSGYKGQLLLNFMASF